MKKKTYEKTYEAILKKKMMLLLKDNCVFTVFFSLKKVKNDFEKNADWA